MRILILGGTGMLGHQLWRVFADHFDTFVTARSIAPADWRLFRKNRTLEHVAVESFDSIAGAVDRIQPQVIINCIGVVKQQAAGKEPIACININALFPHRLAELCKDSGARLIHFSTDCVFSGKKGNYSEADNPEPEDLYGRSKLLGEVTGPNCLTIRSSIIGPELHSRQGLLEWFFSQQGKTIQGFRKAIFSGLTTLAMARLIADVVRHHPNLEGLWHVAAESISKYELLKLIGDTYRLRVNIEPSDSLQCDRSLCGARFHQATGWSAPGWPRLIADLYELQAKDLAAA